MELISFVRQFGYPMVFAGALLDFLGLPIPAEIVLLLAGGLAGGGELSLLGVAGAGTLGALAADHLWYVVGRWRGVRLLRLYCRFSLGSAHCVARTEELLRRVGPASLLIGKFLIGVRAFAAPLAGASRVPYGRYLVFNGLGTLAWASVASSLGFVFRHQIETVAIGAHQLIRGAGIALVASMLVYAGWKSLRRRRHDPAEPSAAVAMAAASAGPPPVMASPERAGPGLPTGL
ncbi:MAG: DedA family protein [Deltaproteobacteria bacterium]|nr:DedA family protein [Deltaproteobacteria bacterium]MBI3079420.1 DedA family protein [Deltaproteobacteria bacterium]